MTAPAPAAPATPSRGRYGILQWIALLFVILTVVVVGFLGFASTVPDPFTVTRSKIIDASPEQLFPWINNLHKSHQWSPWTELDPNGKFTFEGPEEGVGAIQAWDGNDKMGAGKMTITESEPNKVVSMKLEFKRPMEDTSTSKLELAPEGSKTKVTWSMAGRYQNTFQKAICLLMNMDKMVGSQFEKGLNNLDAVVAADQESSATAK